MFLNLNFSPVYISKCRLCRACHTLKWIILIRWIISNNAIGFALKCFIHKMMLWVEFKWKFTSLFCEKKWIFNQSFPILFYLSIYICWWAGRCQQILIEFRKWVTKNGKRWTFRRGNFSRERKHFFYLFININIIILLKIFHWCKQ